MTTRARGAVTAAAIGIVYILHQDVWQWRAAQPLLFGLLPPALWYHALYTLAAAALLAALVRWSWPHDLDR